MIKFDSIFKFFLATIIVGPGIGYSKVYLFHVALVILIIIWFWLSFKGEIVPLYKPESWLFYYFIIMFFWYTIGLFWSINSLYTVRYLFYLIMGIAIIFFVVAYVVDEQIYHQIFDVLKWIIILEIGIALLESFTSFRLPTSPYSQYADLLGRKQTDFEQFNEDAIGIIKSAPTAFLGNPNNLAVVMSTIIPYFFFSKKQLVKWLGVFAVLLVIIYAGSRGAFLAAIFGFFIYVLVKSYSQFFLMISSLLILIMVVSGNLDMFKNSENRRIAEIAYSGDALMAYVFEDEGSDSSSISARKELIVNGLAALKQSYGLGVGGGGSQAVQELQGGVLDRLLVMHNFWVEVLVDAGVLFFVSFVAWYFLVFYKLFSIYKHAKSAFYRYHAGALCVSFAVFSVACISASSVIYLLPMWLMFAMAITVISIYNRSAMSLSYSTDVQMVDAIG